MTSVLSQLLFCLLLQCTPAYSQSPCMIPNGTISDSFNLTIDSTDYVPNKTYNVTILGIEDQVEVALSAVVNSSSFGNWMGNSANCSGVLETRNMTKTNMWTSPANMSANVKISAYVKTPNGTFLSTAFISSEQHTTTASTAMSEPSTAPTASMASTVTSHASTGSMASTAASSPSTAFTGSMASTAVSNPSTAFTGSMTNTAASSLKTNSGVTTVDNNVTATGPTNNETTMNISTNPATTPKGNAMSAFKTSSGFVITLMLFALIAVQQSQ